MHNGYAKEGRQDAIVGEVERPKGEGVSVRRQDARKAARRDGRLDERRNQPAAAPAEKTPKRKAKAGKPKKVSAFDATAKVLGENGEPMSCQELIAAMAEKGYWKSANGQTPAGTLYSAILREAKAKGKESKFANAERGKFALASAKSPTIPPFFAHEAARRGLFVVGGRLG